VPLGTPDDYIRLSQHPDLWHPMRGPRMIMTHAAAVFLRPLYEQLIPHIVPSETILCAHVLDFASRLAGEKLRLPVAGVIFAPSAFWSAHDSPRFKGTLVGDGVPRWLKQLQFWAADTLVAQRILGPSLNRFRAELGLPPVRRIFSRWLHQTDLSLCLFPEWFGPPQADWPAHRRVVGFPLWDAHLAELAPDVRDFLAAGSPPIAFSPGSANREAQSFFAAAVEACERLGRRGILLTKYGEQVPAQLPPGVRHFGFVPLSKLLPHTAALVHHGGIGSCAQGLAAGVPHVVQPMSYDQFDNARRLARLGVAKEIPVRKFRGPAIADALDSLLGSPTVVATCRELASRCNGPAALSAACDALEHLTNSRASR